MRITVDINKGGVTYQAMLINITQIDDELKAIIWDAGDIYMVPVDRVVEWSF